MPGGLSGMQATEAGAQQFVDTMKRNMQMLLQIAGATLEGADRIRKIQMAAAKSAQEKTTGMQRSFGKVGAPGEAGRGNIRQGMLESSNVNVVEELVEMIECQRAYEISSKMISAVSGAISTVVRMGKIS